jgi:hypothetical protein
MLSSRMVSRDLSSKIREFQHHCFRITLSLQGLKQNSLLNYSPLLKSLHGVENAIEMAVSTLSPYFNTLHKVLLLTHVASALLHF